MHQTHDQSCVYSKMQHSTSISVLVLTFSVLFCLSPAACLPMSVCQCMALLLIVAGTVLKEIQFPVPLPEYPDEWPTERRSMCRSVLKLWSMAAEDFTTRPCEC